MDDVPGAQKTPPLGSKQNPWGEDAGVGICGILDVYLDVHGT